MHPTPVGAFAPPAFLFFPVLSKDQTQRSPAMSMGVRSFLPFSFYLFFWRQAGHARGARSQTFRRVRRSFPLWLLAAREGKLVAGRKFPFLTPNSRLPQIGLFLPPETDSKVARVRFGHGMFQPGFLQPPRRGWLFGFFLPQPPGFCPPLFLDGNFGDFSAALS